MRTWVFVDIWIICLLLFMVNCQQNNGNTASGNAMDLAMMNMNMMGHSSKCDIQPCQSVCQVLDKTSGCYVCSSSCNTGTGTNMNAAPLNPQVPQMQLGVSGCDPNWIQCPMFCRVNTYGCMKCSCSTSKGSHTSSEVFTRTTASAEITTKHQTENHFHSNNRQSLFTTFLVSSTESSITTASSKPVFTTQPSSKTTLPKSSTIRLGKNETITFKLFSTRTPLKSASSEMQNVHNRHISLSKLLNGNISLNAFREGYLESESNGDSASLKGILVFALTGLLLIAFTVSIVLAIVWRRSVGKLKRQKSELYFIHKAYRQDSRAKLRNNEFDMDEPVYARIDNKPEVPPRSLETSLKSPTAPLELLLRTESLTSETSIKHVEETTHDYLELES